MERAVGTIFPFPFLSTSDISDKTSTGRFRFIHSHAQTVNVI